MHIFTFLILLMALSLPTFAYDEIFFDEAGDYKKKKIDLDRATKLNKIIAIVNDDIILESQLAAHYRKTQQELASRGIRIDNPNQILSKVLDNLILETIQIQKADQRNLQVADEDVLVKLEEIAQNNQLSLSDLRTRLNQMQPNGFETLRNDVKKQLIMQKLREVEVVDQTQVTEDEINSYLQRQTLSQANLEYHLNHIMVSLPDSATPTDREAVENKTLLLLEKLRAGENFQQLAIRHSAGSQALNGGDLGWLKSDQVPTFFSDVIQDMNPGELSPIIKSPVGYHIIQLKGKRNQGEQHIQQYHIHRFILLSDDAKTATQVPKNILRIANNIRNLADFNALKAEYTDQPESLNRQTDLGWIALNKLPQQEAAILSTLSEKTATAIPTQEGWAILYVEEIKSTQQNETEQRLKAMQTLRMKKANEILEVWLRRIREDAIVEIKSPLNNRLN